ncbi:surface-adhesin E family protein [Caballeronia terrestris]|uniref:surface-adhesin E family protein n=1 Tax=Caballeronia terrestris TaxID=1226301 RepID=UPI000F73B80F|nr:hypothetical protein [Caballeronia terrestris]
MIHKEMHGWVGADSDTGTNTQIHNSPWSILVDRDSIVRDGQSVTVWWKLTASSTDGQHLDWLQQIAFDCHSHQYRRLKSGSRLNASQSYKWADVPEKVFAIEPDDPWDHVFAAVCLNKWKN